MTTAAHPAPTPLARPAGPDHQAGPAPASREPRPIPVRRVAFDFSNERPYWMLGEPSLTHLLHALSAAFPDGERMFMDSVAHYRKQITDPALKKEVARFLAQEATHAKAHEELNAWVRAQGFDNEPLLASVKERIALGRKHFPPIMRLAATCALEHFTAIMAEQLLTEPEMLAQFDPKMAELWLWHAIEETEHKSVAFDVYEHVGGTYPRRVLAMAIITFRFITHVAWMKQQLMKNDPNVRAAKGLEGLRVRLQSTWTLWGNPGWFRKLVPAYLDYYRPGFHPWDRDTTEALRRAREKLGFDPEGRESVDDRASSAA
ncbi:MAG: metal-dependent hydrolase [Myxococcales bacterium]|nr:metal-dependent hydrolase [Myxococcales bacterium]HQY61245.1 metal-dependent hydrolase [Polyangiaceae bacterium]